MITKLFTAALILLTASTAFADEPTIFKNIDIWTISKVVNNSDSYCVMDINIDQIAETDGVAFSLAKHSDGRFTIVILSEVPYMPADGDPVIPGIVAFDDANIGVGSFEPFGNTGLAIQVGVVDENFTARFVETKVLSVADPFNNEKAVLHLSGTQKAYDVLQKCAATLR